MVPLQDVMPDLSREVDTWQLVMEREGTRWYAAETGSGMTLGDAARLICGDVTTDGEAMSR